MPPELLAQFPVLEDALRAFGVTVWPMVELEADDALATAARVARADDRVEMVIVCTPDKDLGQCVGDKVVQLDRRNDRLLDAAGVEAKFGVPPRAIADYLALVGDSADGFPGLPGFGAKTAAAVLQRYGDLESIPDDPKKWDVDNVRSVDRLAATLAAGRRVAELFKRLATLRTDADVGTVDDWEWRGPAADVGEWATRFGAPELVERAERLSLRRAGA
jgi:5'-3' exonuclease